MSQGPMRMCPLYKVSQLRRALSIFAAGTFLFQTVTASAASTAVGVPVPASQTAPSISANDGSSNVSQKVSLDKVAGKVQVRKDGSLLFADAKDGQVISTGDTIRTEEGTCDIILENNTTLTVAPQTTLAVSQATFDAMAKNRTTVLKLDMGRLKAKVGKLQGGSRFEVVTPTAVAAVRGTVFYLDAGTTLGKMFTELYVDESSGGVLFKNSKTGAEFLVPSFGGSSTFGDGSILAPHLLDEASRNAFINKWENQINQVLAQIQIEEQAKEGEGEEGEGEEDGNDKKSEQNTTGNSALDKLLKLLQRYSQNVGVIGSLTATAIKDVKTFNDKPVQDPQILRDYRADLLENVTDFEEDSALLLLHIAAGLNLHEDILGAKDELKDLLKQMRVNYIEALGVLLNDPLLVLAIELGADVDDLLEEAYQLLADYNLNIENAEDTLQGLLVRQHNLNVDKIELKANNAQCDIDNFREDIPCEDASREEVLLKSSGLSELIRQNAENCDFDEWAYETVQYGDDSNPLGEVFGNGDLGVVAHTSAESAFLVEDEDWEDPNIDRDVINERTEDLEEGFSNNTVEDDADHLQDLQDDLDQLAIDADAEDQLRNKAFVAEAGEVKDEFDEYLDEVAEENLSKLQTLVADKASVELLREVERAALRAEIRKELHRITVDIELDRDIASGEKKMDAQTGKVFTDIHGNRVRVDQYIFMPDDENVQVLSLTLRTAGPQQGVSGFSFGASFNRGIDVPLRELPWNDYLNVVEEHQVSAALSPMIDQNDPHYDQYIIHEHNSELARGENPLYPTSFYAEFRNPEAGRGASDTVRFDETYSEPFELTFTDNTGAEPADVTLAVQGRTSDTMTITPVEGDSLQRVVSYNSESECYNENLYINGDELYDCDYYTNGGDGVQTSSFHTDVQDNGYQNLDYYRNLEANKSEDTSEHIHPAYFHDGFYIYGEEEDVIQHSLIGLFIPINNNGQVLEAPGFTIRGIRDLIAPNPLVNGGNYNLEVMFFYGHDEYVYNEATESYDRHFASDFEIDTIITPEIFKPYGTSNSSSLFPASSYEDMDGGEED